MTTELATKACKPCRGGIPPLARDEALALLREVPGWELSDDASRMGHTYKVGDFTAALAFANKIGALAEEEWHHPDLSLGWGYVTVSLRTKKIQGLHENDFIMAAKIDRLFAPGLRLPAGNRRCRPGVPFCMEFVSVAVVRLTLLSSLVLGRWLENGSS